MRLLTIPPALAILCAALSGCLQVEQKNVVNPDGSGRFTVEQKVNMGAMAGMLGGLGGPGQEGGPKMGPAEMQKAAHQSLVSLIAGAQGVDVWTSATATAEKDGSIVVKASGLFKDLTKLQVGGNTSSGDASMSNEGMGEMMKLQISKDDQGNMVLEAPLEKTLTEANKKKKEQGGGEAPKTPEERKAKRAKDLQEMEMMTTMMAAMLKDAKMTYSFNFGTGKVLEHGAFTLVNPNTISMEMKPVNVFAGMKAVMSDEKLAEIMDTSDSFDPKNPDHQKVVAKMTEAIYGKGGKPRAVVKTAGAVFDFTAESAKAKAGQTDELKAILKEAAEKQQKKPFPGGAEEPGGPGKSAPAKPKAA